LTLNQNKTKAASTAFKAKVALEAVKERLTLAQIASAYRVHPTEVGVWKRQLLEAAPVALARPQDPTAAAALSPRAAGGTTTTHQSIRETQPPTPNNQPKQTYKTI